MKKSVFVKSVLNLLGDAVIEHEEHEPDTVTMLVKDVNAEIEGKDLMEYIKEELEAKEFNDISFSFGNGHWMTIHNYKRF
ncbi:hypothetical protein [Virgibacillus sp. L01]|uniref:hypothetical protein n=1 Tax=Virgibacillus sp. L01 TaxID=3457429 RepID=UPI003FD66B52